MKDIDIINLIEKNSITRLSKTYENKLINKIKVSFSDTEQKLFLASFYCFLNYDSKKDFVVDFDKVWKWLGFTRKSDGKRLLEKHFTIDIDYQIKKLATEIAVASFEQHGGQNKEIIMLTVNTFKKFCLKAGTNKADEVHNYYIKLENLLQETLNEETNELRLQLSNKEKENNKLEEEKNKLEEENKKLTRKYIKKEKEIYDDKNVVYLMTTDEAEKKGEYAVGKAYDLTKRKGDYNHNKLHDFKVVYYICCKGPKIMDCLESLILSKLGKYRCKAGRDAFCIPDNNDVSLFTNMFDICFTAFFIKMGHPLVKIKHTSNYFSK